MTIIVCVDDDWGMMFNHRRQSQDKVLREHILKEINGNTLWMNGYSAKMFGNHPEIYVDEDFIQKAGSLDFCFIENISVLPYRHLIDRVVLYKWNKVYPADKYFDLFLSENEWHLISSEDFVGNSHEKITEEVYEK